MHLSLFSFNAHDLSLSAVYMVQIDYVCKITRLGITLKLASELVLTAMCADATAYPPMPRSEHHTYVSWKVPLSSQHVADGMTTQRQGFLQRREAGLQLELAAGERRLSEHVMRYEMIEGHLSALTDMKFKETTREEGEENKAEATPVQ